mgnify:CR=1 FL=1
MQDNVTAAILMGVNALAERYGLRPYDFVAVVDDSRLRETVLRFESPPPEEKSAAFEKMLAELGIAEDSLELSGSDENILDALDSALKKAPRASKHR